MMKISLIVEGETEKIFLDSARNFLRPRCPAGAMPKLVARPLNSNIPPRRELIKIVRAGLPSPNNQVFVHAAQYELEAWLIPYWPWIQQLALSQRPKPSKTPEQINNQNPPSKLLSELWRTGGRKSKSYNKVLHLPKILEGQDLEHASKECPTLKSFLNRLLTLSGAPAL